MNKFTLTILTILFLSLVSCSNEKANNELITINIEEAINNPVKIKASQLGDNIRYIPLESIDTSMLVGVNPLVRKYKNNLIVASAKNKIKVFDATTGKYKNSVGMQGRGPNESYSLDCYSVNPFNGNIYIDASNGESFRVWDINGNYLETFTPQSDVKIGGFASKVSKVLFFNNENEIALYNGDLIDFISTDGSKISSIIVNDNNEGISSLDPSNINSITVQKNTASGSMSNGYGSLIVGFKDGKYSYFLQGNESFWMYDNNLYIKDLMCDTAYVVANDTLIPRIVFNCGSYNLTPSEQLDCKFEADKKAIIGQIKENAKTINFELIYNKETYYGVYNKKTKDVILGKLSDGVEDDINGVIDLSIMYSTPKGEYISVIDAINVVDYLEENPSKSSVLPNVGENDNCIVAIIESK